MGAEDIAGLMSHGDEAKGCLKVSSDREFS
jgi:hypothetical protein